MYPLLTFRQLFVHHLRLSDVAVSRKKTLSAPYPHCFVSLRNRRLLVRIQWGVLTCFTQVKASKLLRALGGFFRLVSTIYVVFAVLRFSAKCFQTLPSALSLHTICTPDTPKCTPNGLSAYFSTITLRLLPPAVSYCLSCLVKKLPIVRVSMP